MQLTNKILNILNSITGIKTVLYESGYGTNLRLDRRETPAAILYMLQEYTIDLAKGIKREIVDVEVFICDRCDLAAKGEVVQQKLDTLLPYVNQFVALLTSEKTLLLDGDSISVQMAYGKFDTNVCGYSLQFKASERQGGCIDGDTSGVNQIVITSNGTHNIAAYGEALVNVQGGSIVLQEKTAVANGVVTPDTGYDGLSKVTVQVPTPTPVIRLQEKTTNTNGYVTFDNGYDGLQGVTVQVPQPSGRISVDITQNGTEIWDVTNYENIAITTAVPTQTCDLYTGLTVEANGIYNPLTYNKDGFSTFVVNIPQPQGTLQRTISTNGTQTYDVSLWENIEITTNVPTQTCNLYTGLSITQNGTYNPSQYGDYDGFGSISVNVQPQNVGTGVISNPYSLNGWHGADEFGYDYLDGVDVQLSVGEAFITDNGIHSASEFGFDLLNSVNVNVQAQCQGNLPVTITNTGIETVNCCGYDSVSIDTSQIQGYNTWKGTYVDYMGQFPLDNNTLYLITD